MSAINKKVKYKLIQQAMLETNSNDLFDITTWITHYIGQRVVRQKSFEAIPQGQKEGYIVSTVYEQLKKMGINTTKDILKTMEMIKNGSK